LAEITLATQVSNQVDDVEPILMDLGT